MKSPADNKLVPSVLHRGRGVIVEARQWEVLEDLKSSTDVTGACGAVSMGTKIIGNGKHVQPKIVMTIQLQVPIEFCPFLNLLIALSPGGTDL